MQSPPTANSEKLEGSGMMFATSVSGTAIQGMTSKLLGSNPPSTVGNAKPLVANPSLKA